MCRGAIGEAAGQGAVWLQGGGDLVGQFLDAGALNEIQVSIAPALLAAGAPLLPRDIGPGRLRLKAAAAVGQFVHATYEVG
jgi:dihydrofolate reductase